jgi:hypothetical protein
MQKTAGIVVFLLLCVPLACGCAKSGENQVVQGTGDEITPEMIATEESDLETPE